LPCQMSIKISAIHFITKSTNLDSIGKKLVILWHHFVVGAE
jgi:hypothetical protein